MKPGTRVAIYTRISTKEGKQHLETQLKALHEFAGRMEWKVTQTYSDQITGRSDRRPGLDLLLIDASRRLFDLVLIFELSRFTRAGVASAFHLIAELDRSNVDLWSFNEPQFRTTPAARELLIAVSAYLADIQTRGRSESVRAGLERAKAQGTRLGRRPVIVDRQKILEMRARGLSVRKIAAELEISRGKVERSLKPHAPESAPEPARPKGPKTRSAA